jgi:hypothetical protein
LGTDDYIECGSRTTAHDLDFAFFLKLNSGLGKLKKIRIICLPQKRYTNIVQDLCRTIDRVIK